MSLTNYISDLELFKQYESIFSLDAISDNECNMIFKYGSQDVIDYYVNNYENDYLYIYRYCNGIDDEYNGLIFERSHLIMLIESGRKYKASTLSYYMDDCETLALIDLNNVIGPLEFYNVDIEKLFKLRPDFIGRYKKGGIRCFDVKHDNTKVLYENGLLDNSNKIYHKNILTINSLLQYLPISFIEECISWSDATLESLYICLILNIKPRSPVSLSTNYINNVIALRLCNKYMTKHDKCHVLMMYGINHIDYSDLTPITLEVHIREDEYVERLLLLPDNVTVNIILESNCYTERSYNILSSYSINEIDGVFSMSNAIRFYEFMIDDYDIEIDLCREDMDNIIEYKNGIMKLWKKHINDPKVFRYLYCNAEFILPILDPPISKEYYKFMEDNVVKKMEKKYIGYSDIEFQFQ